MYHVVPAGQKTSPPTEIGCSDVAGVRTLAVLDFGVLVVRLRIMPSRACMSTPGREESVKVMKVPRSDP